MGFSYLKGQRSPRGGPLLKGPAPYLELPYSDKAVVDQEKERIEKQKAKQTETERERGKEREGAKELKVTTKCKTMVGGDLVNIYYYCRCTLNVVLLSPRVTPSQPYFSILMPYF